MTVPSTAANPSREAAVPALEIATDKLAFIIERAREYDVKEADSDPDSGSNAADDGQTDILEDKPGDATGEELAGAIGELNDDERAQLVALAWLGRGTYELAEWKEAVRSARAEHGSRQSAIRYLLQLPLLGDYLEDGMAVFDEGIVDDDPTEGLNGENAPLGNMADRPPRQ